MAGIWNRIYDRGEGTDPLPSLLVSSAIYMVTRGVYTATQARDALNATLQHPLTTDELTDLNQIVTNANVGNAATKLDFVFRLQALCLAVECPALTNEASFRSELGLP